MPTRSFPVGASSDRAAGEGAMRKKIARAHKGIPCRVEAWNGRTRGRAQPGVSERRSPFHFKRSELKRLFLASLLALAVAGGVHLQGRGNGLCRRQALQLGGSEKNRRQSRTS